MSKDIRCDNCKYFTLIEGRCGKCKLAEGMIGEGCFKYQWCKDFEEAEDNE